MMLQRVFRARVVAGHHDEARPARGDGRHLRAFAAIALAAAAEEHHHAAGSDFMRGAQHLLQSIRLVRVIDAPRWARSPR